MMGSSRAVALTILTCVCGVTARPLVAQMPFHAPSFTCTDQPGAIAAGDLDGDGDADLVIALPAANAVGIRTTNGAGFLAIGATLTVGTDPQDVALHDLDGDGRLDIVAANAGSGDVAVLRGLAGGAFAPATFHATDDGASAITIGDVDGDLAPDLVVVNGESETISVLRNVGGGAFAPAVTTVVGNQPTDAALGDLDSDGDADLAVTRMLSVEDHLGDVLVMLNDSGAFTPDRAYVSGGSPFAPVIVDLHGDTLNDIVVLNRSGWTVTMLLNRGGADFGSGSLEENLQVTVPGITNRRDLAMADLDGDGDLDAAVTGDQMVAVLLNQSSELVWSENYFAHLEADAQARSIALADFTRDGDIDIVSSSSGAVEGHVVMLANQGGAAFGTTIGAYEVSDAAGLGDGPSAVAVGDLNADGFPDMVTANPGTADVTVLHNEGDGTFGAVAINGLPPQQIRPRYAVGSNPQSVAIGDLDGAGGPDVVTADTYGASITVLLNNDLETLDFGGHHPAGLLPSSVLLADLDDDGDLDVIVGRLVGSVSVLANDGDATFGSPIDVEAGSQPRAVAVADLDGDGDLDLAIANQGDETISVVLNQGGLTFVTGDTIAVEEPRWIVAADWNGDGAVDLAVSNKDSGQVWVVTNDGDAGFGVPVGYAGRQGAAHMAAGDLDGDGAPDMAVINGDETVTVLMNRNGAFDVVHHRTFLWETTGVALGDLDVDGQLDLALTDGYPDWMTVMHNVLPAVETTCEVDLDDSGAVGFDDLVLLLGAWGPCPPGDCPADFDGSGSIGFDDLVLLLGDWGPC